MHALDPREKLTRYFSLRFPSSPCHRSGSNFQGSGKISELKCRSNCDILISQPAGIVQCLYTQWSAHEEAYRHRRRDALALCTVNPLPFVGFRSASWPPLAGWLAGATLEFTVASSAGGIYPSIHPASQASGRRRVCVCERDGTQPAGAKRLVARRNTGKHTQWRVRLSCALARTAWRQARQICTARAPMFVCAPSRQAAAICRIGVSASERASERRRPANTSIARSASERGYAKRSIATFSPSLVCSICLSALH